jgi:DNA-binding transcriptional ArsR family regulator
VQGGRKTLASEYPGMLFAHPLRLRIFLSLLDGGEASPSELARTVDARLPNVSYHVRTLADLGLIECVREEPRRGATEHYYVAATTPQEVFNRLVADASSGR